MSHEKLMQLFEMNQGLLLIKQAVEAGFEKSQVDELVKLGLVRRIGQGLYLTEEACEDELFFIQALGNRAVYSHESALYLHQVVDHMPDSWTVTVPAGYSAIHLRAHHVNVHFMKKSLYELGVIQVTTSEGRTLYTYDLERTLCDLIRNRNDLAEGFLETVLEQYLASAAKRPDVLIQYARQFKIEAILKHLVEKL